MAGVDLDAVDAGPSAPLGRVGEALDDGREVCVVGDAVLDACGG